MLGLFRKILGWKTPKSHKGKRHHLRASQSKASSEYCRWFQSPTILYVHATPPLRNWGIQLNFSISWPSPALKLAAKRFWKLLTKGDAPVCFVGQCGPMFRVEIAVRFREGNYHQFFWKISWPRKIPPQQNPCGSHFSIYITITWITQPTQPNQPNQPNQLNQPSHLKGAQGYALLTVFISGRLWSFLLGPLSLRNVNGDPGFTVEGWWPKRVRVRKLTNGYSKWWFGKGDSGLRYGHFWYLCLISGV